MEQPGTELLAGKVAVITGGGRGIGRACALLFAQHGARVVVADLGCGRDGRGQDPTIARAVADEIQTTGKAAVALCTDVATRRGADELAEAAVRAFGRIDVLVNASAVARPEALLDSSEGDWRAVLAATLDATLYATQAAGRVMKTLGGGRIVNMTGFEGLIGGFGLAATAAAQAGVYGLTRASSIELERDRIIVNAVAPLTRSSGGEDEDAAEDRQSLSPDHVAPVVLLLASDLFGDRSGLVVGVAGSRISAFRVVESQGKTKPSNAPWTPAEIVEHWTSIARIRG